jgi:hypothetical protein
LTHFLTPLATAAAAAMDPAPRGLAPGGPGATGAPLLDWILADPGLAGAVLSSLAPADVLGLRASCQGAQAAVAGHGWESPAALDTLAWDSLPPPLGEHVQMAASTGDKVDGYIPPHGPLVDFSGGRAALARWRACFPRARSVVVRDPTDGVTDADVAALAADCSQLATLGLVDCEGLTDAALAPFDRLTSLALTSTPSLSGACWGGLAGRLRSVTTAWTGPVTDDHLPALAGCTHVSLGAGAAVTDAGIAAHLSGRVTHLGLELMDCLDFDGSGLRACRGLVELRLVYSCEYVDSPVPLAPDALAGCAGSLVSLVLIGVDGGDALFAAGGGGGGGGLPALRRATLWLARSLTDAAFAGTTPRLVELAVATSDSFVGGAGLGCLPCLTSLDVSDCASFTGGALVAGYTPALRWLAVRGCGLFGGRVDVDGSDSGGGGSGGAEPFPQPSPMPAAPALPALAGALVLEAPALTDAWFANTPRVAYLYLDCCSSVIGCAAVASRLPALTHLTVSGCDAFTGAWLGAAGGGASARLKALNVRCCRSLSLPDALAPEPHPRLWWVGVVGAVGAATLLTDELLGRLPALEWLVARDCAGFVGGPGLGGRLPALAFLDVEACADFTGTGLGGLNALRRLDVVDCPRVGRAALAAAAAGCPALTAVSFHDSVSSRWGGGGNSTGGGDSPLPVTPLSLGPGWVVDARQTARGLPISRHTWAVTRAPAAVPAAFAAAAAAGGADGGGGDERGASPPVRQARPRRGR